MSHQEMQVWMDSAIQDPARMRASSLLSDVFHNSSREFHNDVFEWAKSSYINHDTVAWMTLPKHLKYGHGQIPLGLYILYHSPDAYQHLQNSIDQCMVSSDPVQLQSTFASVRTSHQIVKLPLWYQAKYGLAFFDVDQHVYFSLMSFSNTRNHVQRSFARKYFFHHLKQQKITKALDRLLPATPLNLILSFDAFVVAV